MSISTTQAQISVKKVFGEASLLSPSSLITLWEIDVTNLGIDQGVTLEENEKIFRFHNNVNLTTNNLTFQGKTYNVAPIQAEGFEISSKGAIPTPKLALTVDDSGLPFFSLFKNQLKRLGDLTGAKVTRIRTFAKYLDGENWAEGIPDGFAPDSYAEFPRDVYYIDRKSNENKFGIEFELASILDLENLQLPSRLIFARRCSWQYRGEGCCYEYPLNRTDETIHGDSSLPNAAPPIATENDEKISTILGANIPIKAPELYFARKLSAYVKGSSVYITKNGLNYYFVCKVDGPATGPPNTNYWVADTCSKTIPGCRLRFGSNGSVDPGNSNVVKGQLRFGGFAAVDKVG